MPAITLPYAYPDGTVFDPSEHNKNVYDVGTASNGIMSVPNGGLEYDSSGSTKNLANDFVLYAEHVQPGCGIQGGIASNIRPADYTDQAFSDDTGATYVRIAGPSVRFDASRTGPVLLALQFYLSVHKPIVDSTGGTATIEPDIILRPKLNGSAITNLARNMPASVAYDLNAGDAFPANSREARVARHYSLTYLMTATEGMNEVGMELYIQKVDKTVPFSRTFGTGAPAVTVNGSHNVGTRVTFGVRLANYLEL